MVEAWTSPTDLGKTGPDSEQSDAVYGGIEKESSTMSFFHRVKLSNLTLLSAKDEVKKAIEKNCRSW